MRATKQQYTIIKSCKGSSNFIIVCSILMVVIVSAVAADIIYAALIRYKITNVSEEVVKAGVKELVSRKGKPADEMRKYAVKNIGGLTGLEIVISDDKKEVTVQMKKPISYIFLKFLGIKGKLLSTTVSSKLSSVSSIKDVRPIAVENTGIVIGKQYTLAIRTADDHENMHFVPIDLGSPGYKNNLVFGYPEKLKAGDELHVLSEEQSYETVESLEYLTDECKHIPECTYENFSDDCSRIIIIPVVEKLDVNSQNAMSIKGFAAFYIEESLRVNGKVVIKGRFVRHVVEAGTSDGVEDFGLTGIDIVRLKHP